jgi:hypothetical protein
MVDDQLYEQLVADPERAGDATVHAPPLTCTWTSMLSYFAHVDELFCHLTTTPPPEKEAVAFDGADGAYVGWASTLVDMLDVAVGQYPAGLLASVQNSMVCADAVLFIVRLFVMEATLLP